MVLDRYEQRRVQELNNALESVDFRVSKRTTRSNSDRLKFELVVCDEAGTVNFTHEGAYHD